MQLEDSYNHFVEVTELAGDEVSREQVLRLCHKYYWAGEYSRGKDVVEVGCGTGPGLGYLATIAKSVSAGDISKEIVDRAKLHYGNRVEILQYDAEHLPYEAASKDVIMLFEAIYYLKEPEKFLAECRRVLRPGGHVLIVTCNKDLYGFNPSPYSHRYFGVVELKSLLEEEGFATKFLGNLPMDSVSWRQKALQPVKKLAVSLNLVPKTMAGKKFLKRMVFGKMATMPAEVVAGMVPFEPPTVLPTDRPDVIHKVIFCEARLRLPA